MRLRTAIAAWAVIACLAAGCGGDIDSASDTQPTPTPATVDPTPTPEPERTIEPTPTLESEPTVEPVPTAEAPSTKPTGPPSPWPWHAADSAHTTPEDAVAEFLDFIGFAADGTLGEFQPGDSRSGEIVVDGGLPEGEVDLTTTVFVRLDDEDSWVVIAAASNAVQVDSPHSDDRVAPPLAVRFIHNNPVSRNTRVELWPQGASSPAVAQDTLGSGRGVFAMGPQDRLLDWPSEVTGPAIAIFKSIGDDTVAVTTVSIELTEDQNDPPPVPDTMLGPVGAQRMNILYQPGVRLSLHGPTACDDRSRPVVVTGGPSSPTFVDEFVARGYVVADIAWRTPGFTGGFTSGTATAFTFAVNDLGVAVQWLRHHADELCLDADQIAAVGYSFGAVTALLQAYSEGEVDFEEQLTISELGGAVDLPTNPPMAPPELAAYSNELNAVVSFAGFAISGTVDPGEPPSLLFHGRNDGTVPFALAEQTCADAAQAGVTCQLIAHDEGHAMADDVDAALELADEFLRRELDIDGGPGP